MEHWLGFALDRAALDRAALRRATIALVAIAASACAAEGAPDAYEPAAQIASAADVADAPASDTDTDTAPASAFPAAAPGRAGSFATVTERNVGPSNAFTLVRPRDLASSNRKHPLITWGNGTSASPAMYASLLNRLASHGFVVIASNSPNTGNAVEMLKGVDWVLAQNQASGSALSGKIDIQRIAATGHSQGGLGTCAATRDARIKTIVIIQGQGVRDANWRGPLLTIVGTQDTTVSASQTLAAFPRVSSGPAMYAELKSASHLNWMSGSSASGEAMNEMVTAWFRVHLMNDGALRSYFYGSTCRFCTNSAWTVQQKEMD